VHSSSTRHTAGHGGRPTLRWLGEKLSCCCGRAPNDPSREGAPRTVVMFSPDEAGDHPVVGRAGPEWKGELLKQSAHIGKWADRYFVLKDRKLWYYEAQSDARPSRGKPMGEPKGYFDCVAATFELFEEEDDGEIFFGFELEEEYGLWTGGIEASGDKIRLCHSVIEARDHVVEKLRYAARPSWVANDDERASVCMETKEPFTMFDRKHQ
jgi:hypothetical protein